MRRLPVERYRIRLDRAPVNESLAQDACRLLLRAQGWTPVGEPEVLRSPEGIWCVECKLVRAELPETLLIDPSITAVTLP